jgi:hypothetical protein
MIKNITPGAGITVNNSHSSWPSFYNSIGSTGNNLIGQMRYNGSNQNIEVYDGTAWLMMTPAYPTIELAPHVQAVVVWAQGKMAEESRLNELAARHPAVADAVSAVARAEEQLRIVAALVQE